MATKNTMTTGAFLEKMLQVEPVLVADFFISNRIVFPKKIKMDIMKNALRAYVVKTRKECLTLDSRKNYNHQVIIVTTFIKWRNIALLSIE